MWKKQCISIQLLLLMFSMVNADTIRSLDRDLNQDGIIDVTDVGLMANAWLGSTCSYINPCNNADIFPVGGDGKVNLLDFAYMAGGFGECFDPTDPTCNPIPLSLLAPPSHVVDNGVQPYSGAFITSTVDMQIAGRGLDLIWSRTYRSRGENKGNNENWHFSGNISLTDYSGSLLLIDETGRGDRFYLQPSGKWIAAGIFNEIAYLQGHFVMTFPDASTWQFHDMSHVSAPGKIKCMTDRYGNTIGYEYDQTGRLIAMRDTLDSPVNSRVVTIGYNAIGLIESVSDWTGRQVIYEYFNHGDANGASGDLKSVRTPIVTGTPNGNDFPTGKTTRYTYTTGFSDERLNHNLLTITDPNGQLFMTNTYATTTNALDIDFDRVVRQVLGDPTDIIDYVYLPENPSVANNFTIMRAVMNDRVGHVSEYGYDQHHRVTSSRDYTGSALADLPTTINPDSNLPTAPLRSYDPVYYEVTYLYNNDALPIQTTFQNGNQTLTTYDSLNVDVRSRGNVTAKTLVAGPLGGDQQQITEIFEYDPAVNHQTNYVTRHIDGRGNETLYNYDGVGNLISETNVRLGNHPNIITTYGYNAFGQKITMVYPDNGFGVQRVDSYDYYGAVDGVQSGYRKSAICGSGIFDQTTTYVYDALGRVTTIVDPNNNDSFTVYNALDQVVQSISGDITHTGNSTITGNLTRQQVDTFYDQNDNIERVECLNINHDGNLDPVLQALGTSYTYDILNNIIRVEKEVDVAQNIVTTFEYDGNRNVTLARSGVATNGTQPTNEVRTIYDERDLVFQVISGHGDVNQSTTQFDYDGNGNKISARQGIDGNPSRPNTTAYTYDGYDRLATETDPMGNVTALFYDQNSNVVTEMNKGELVDVLASAGNVRLTQVDYQYDDLDRLIVTEAHFFDPNTQIDIGDGRATTSYSYSDLSQPLVVIDDLSRQTSYEYDALGRVLRQTDGKGNLTDYGYDQKSNVTTVVVTDKSDLGLADDIFVTTYDYDGIDRLVRETDNDGNVSTMRHDSRNNVTVATDGLGNETGYTYDGANRLIATTYDMDNDGADGDGTDIISLRSYDDASRLTSQTDPAGNTTVYTYDALNRKTAILHADGTTTSYTYDLHDNMLTETAATGTVITRTYDNNNQCSDIIYIFGGKVASTTTFNQFSYDGLGRLISAGNDSSIVTRWYDSHGNLTQENRDDYNHLNGISTVRIHHNSVRLGITTTTPSGRISNQTFDDLNQLLTVADNDPVVGVMASYAYIGSRVQRLALGNGTNTDYTYDTLGRVSGKSHADALNVIDAHAFVWDALGNKTSRTDNRVAPVVTHHYEYDPIDRLTRTVVDDTTLPVLRDTLFALDDTGNRIAVTGAPGTYAYLMTLFSPPADGQVNQYTQLPWMFNLEYDDNGNLTTALPTAGGGASTSVVYVYDALDRLVTVTDNKTRIAVSYAYDAFNRRTEKGVTSAQGVTAITRYFYDGYRVIEEQDDVGVTTATYLYGPYIDEPITMQRSGIDYYYHTDDMYNVMALTDGTGAVVERYEYDDYGAPNAVSAVGNPYLFNGRRFDDEVALYFYRTRYLDPKAGRFIQRDTIGAWGDGANLGNGNTYAGNNPWSYLDPFGEAIEPRNTLKTYFETGDVPTSQDVPVFPNGSFALGEVAGRRTGGGGHGGTGGGGRGHVRFKAGTELSGKVKAAGGGGHGGTGGGGRGHVRFKAGAELSGKVKAAGGGGHGGAGGGGRGHVRFKAGAELSGKVKAAGGGGHGGAGGGGRGHVRFKAGAALSGKVKAAGGGGDSGTGGSGRGHVKFKAGAELSGKVKAAGGGGNDYVKCGCIHLIAGPTGDGGGLGSSAGLYQVIEENEHGFGHDLGNKVHFNPMATGMPGVNKRGLHETYYNALIGLRRAAPRSSWTPQLTVVKGATRMQDKLVRCMVCHFRFEEGMHICK